MNQHTKSAEAVNLLEQRLQDKINEFEVAENEGKTQSELNHLYQEIKDIRHQISFMQPALRKAVG